MLAVAYILTAVALFSVLDATVKSLGGRIPLAEVILFRSVFAFIPLSVAVWAAGGPPALATTRPGYHVLRGLLGLVAMATFFGALPYMRLADVVAISFSGPLFIALLAGSVLGESIGRDRWAAIVAGFGGVLLIVRPGTSAFQTVSLLPLVGALAYSFIMLLVRRLGAREGLIATSVYFTAVAAVVSAAVTPLVWTTPTRGEWIRLVLAGLAGGGANLCLTQAFRLGPVGLLAPFEYTSLLWGLALGYAFWGEVPDVPMLVGAAIIVASGLTVLPRTEWARMRPRPRT